MALTAILLCLFIQRLLNFDSHTRKYNWFEFYYQWFKDRFSQGALWSGFGGVGIIIIPGLVIYILFALLIYHLLTIIGYYVLTLFVLWYCMDARRLVKENVGNVTAQQIIVNTYQRIFALIFWLLILGSTGLVLYTLVTSLRRQLQMSADMDKQTAGLLSATTQFEGVLDWVPSRLLGISFALVGHFSVAFKFWYRNLATGINHTQQQAVECALAALDMEVQPDRELTEDQLRAVDGLVNRALLVWLVVIALFTIGRWIG